MRNTIQHVLPQNEETIEAIEYRLAQFRKLPTSELIDLYLRQRRIGMVGVSAQAVYMVALTQVLKERGVDAKSWVVRV